MLIPRIRDVSSIGWDGHILSSERPLIFPIDIEIGEEGKGADIYRMEIFNFAWLEQNMRNCGWSWGRARMFMDEFDIDKIRKAVEDKISIHAPYESWPQFAERLAPYIIWEFEGMSYPPFPVIN